MNIYPSSSKNPTSYQNQSPTTSASSRKNILKPIIIGELHGLCNAHLAILKNADKLKETNFKTIAYEGNISTEAFHKGLNNAVKNFDDFKKDVNIVFKHSKLNFPSEDNTIYHKILLIMSDRDVHNGFKSIMNNKQDDDGFDLQEQINTHLIPQIRRLPKDIHPLGKIIIETFIQHPDNIIKLSDTYKPIAQYLLGIALKNKDFQFIMIDQGRENIETMLNTKEMDDPNAIILRNQGMIEEIQIHQQKTTTKTPQGIIAIMGQKHSTILEEDYPNIAHYVDLMEHKKLSVQEALNKNHRTKRLLQKEINFENCFDTILAKKDHIHPDKLTEPSERVMKILYDITKRQASKTKGQTSKNWTQKAKNFFS